MGKKDTILVGLKDIRTDSSSGHVSIVDVYAFLRKGTAQAAASHLTKLIKREGQCPNLKLAFDQGVRFLSCTGQPGYQRNRCAAVRSREHLIKCVFEIYDMVYKRESRQELEHSFRELYCILQTGLCMWPTESTPWPDLDGLDGHRTASGECEQVEGVPMPQTASSTCSLPHPANVEHVSLLVEGVQVVVDVRQDAPATPTPRLNVEPFKKACSLIPGATFDERNLAIECALGDVPTLVDALGIYTTAVFQFRRKVKASGCQYDTWKCRLSDRPDRNQRKKKMPKATLSASTSPVAEESTPSSYNYTVRASNTLTQLVIKQA